VSMALCVRAHVCVCVCVCWLLSSPCLASWVVMCVCADKRQRQGERKHRQAARCRTPFCDHLIWLIDAACRCRQRLETMSDQAQVAEAAVQ